MKPQALVALYPQRWRRRYGAEMAELLAHQRLTAQLVVDLVRGALDARLHPELAGPILAAAGGGMVRVPPRSPRLGALLLAGLLLVLLLQGGLYAVRSQTPAMPQVPVTQVMTEIQAGRVSGIVVEGPRATVTLVDGSREQVATGSSDALARFVTEYNQAHPAQRIELRFQSQTGLESLAVPLSALLALVVTMLPILLLALLVLLLARARPRSERPPPRGVAG